MAVYRSVLVLSKAESSESSWKKNPSIPAVNSSFASKGWKRRDPGSWPEALGGSDEGEGYADSGDGSPDGKSGAYHWVETEPCPA